MVEDFYFLFDVSMQLKKYFTVIPLDTFYMYAAKIMVSAVKAYNKDNFWGESI